MDLYKGRCASCSGSRECYYFVQTRSTTMRDKKWKVWSFKHHLHRVGTFLHLRELGCDEGLQSIGSLTTHDSWSCSAVNEYYHSSAISDFFLIGGDSLQRRIFIFHNYGILPQLRNSSTITEFFHNCGFSSFFCCISELWLVLWAKLCN